MSASREEAAAANAAYRALRQRQIADLAARGRAWLLAEGRKAAEALDTYGAPSQYDYGTYACLVGRLADLRAAWKLAR